MSWIGKIMSGMVGRRPPEMQVAAVCLRQHNGEKQVLLITSRGTGRWVIPKGWPMRGRSLSGAAEQESWEEAGVKGKITTKACGTYTYDKVLESGLAIPVEVKVFKLDVKAVHDDFPEAQERTREWFAPKHAAEKVDEPGLQKLIRSL
ncbi:NUDIX hydrolase [Thioclava sp. SK-1]|uniref:NUDIX hydrolase n=1 Tax=Thioclava sp. SK-1 TaxID=1889770 RepID=UPI00082479EA|nr:NUDIX hydrolase [Thioclava sp. SK-1]OCX59850.1 NUDIX hydrolase [Thioclava sp. SK-1]